MSILDKAKADNLFITGNSSDFGIPIHLKAQDATEIDVVGLHTKHHTGFDEIGQRINSKTASVAINENLLVNFPVRNSNNEVAMLGCLVNCADSTGNIRNFIVQENYPDEALGLIVLILGDYR